MSLKFNAPEPLDKSHQLSPLAVGRIRDSNPPHTRNIENNRTKNPSPKSIQVEVSLSLRIRWIASANPPYTNIPYRLNRRTAFNIKYTCFPLTTWIRIYST